MWYYFQTQQADVHVTSQRLEQYTQVLLKFRADENLSILKGKQSQSLTPN